MSEMFIRDATFQDAAIIADIYNPYILNTVITFEETPVTQEEILARIEGVKALGYPYLVMEQDNEVVGYAYANLWRTRAAYRHTVETSIYLDQNSAGKGLGTTLYQALLDRLKIMDIHVILGGITLPNPVSVRLHEKLGFKKVAHFTQVGYKFGRWLDVGFWELVISNQKSGIRNQEDLINYSGV
jgi:L-amino acid N-acyltransferase YncA